MAHRIHIVAYRSSWPSQGRRAAGRLRSALCERVDDSVCAVHHVGSTAVPGMAAQPILDLVVELGDSEASLAASRSSLLGAGYERCRPVPAPERRRGVRAIYTRDGVDRPAGQQGLLERVLVCEAGHPSIAEALAFRDYLRARPEARWAYAMRKRELVHAHDADSAAYQAGKVAFIDQVQRLADAMLGDARTAGQAEISLVRLPGWVHSVMDADATYPTPDDMMALAVRLARENVERGTGGPFGAAVFDLDAVRLVAVGVNLVERQSASWAHAEMVALALAQQTLGTYDLRSEGTPRCALVTSAEPCAMCLGAVPWSGVQQLVCGARDEDVRAIGFDEGHKPAGWVAALEHRGIAVLRDVLRDEAVAALRAYAAKGGAIYNSGNDAP